MNALDLVLLLVGLLIAGFVGYFLWSRRREEEPDPPGVRSACTFRGGWALLTERERAHQRKVGGAALGDGVSAALAARLGNHGVHVLARDREDHGWGISVSHAGLGAELRVEATVHDDQDEWLLEVYDAASAGPAPEALLPLIDRALHEIPELSAIKWHARQQVHQGEPLSGTDAPIDAG